MTWSDHYMETLGNIPDAIRQLFDLDEGVAKNYTEIRKRAYAPDDQQHLPLRYRELIFVVLDIEVGNYGGAMNHLAAAARAGLTRAELRDALIETLMVRGISTWGLTGHRVWANSVELFEEQKND